MTNNQEFKKLPKKELKWSTIIWLIVLILGLFVSVNVTNAHISVLLAPDNFSQFMDVLVQMCKPDWAYANVIFPYLIETIKMAILGTVIGSVIAFIYSFLIARNIIKNKVITSVLRFIMNIVRTIPDLLLGALFVAIVGIGPVAGILALSVFTFGVVVKLFYEAIETIDNGPIEALTASGASKLQIIHFAVLPQVMTYFVSYVLYAFEINVRASTILGYIGAGGIGLYLQQTLQLFQYNRTGTILIVIIVVVVIIDYISSTSREALTK